MSNKRKRSGLVGTDSPETLTGTPDPDFIDGRGGDNAIFGLGGDDSLAGGEGNDLLDGGVGADLMVGGDGNDSYFVDAADDRLVEAVGKGSAATNSPRVSMAMRVSTASMAALAPIR